MILEDDIRSEAKKRGVLPYFIEKEYLQHMLLNQLSRSDGFVLRGGACLRIPYGYERFSRNLKLVSSLPGDKVKESLHKALKRMTKVDYNLLSERLHEKGYEAMVEFRGPLYYGTSKNTNLLVISVDFRDTLLEPRKLKISPFFGVEYSVLAMDIKEVLAEKLLYLGLKRKPEDAYDVWSILKRGVEVDWALVEKKASQLGQDFSMPSPPFCDKEDYEKTLKNIIPSLPSYEEVVSDLEGFLGNKESAGQLVEKVSEGGVTVATPKKSYWSILGVIFLLGGLFVITYFMIQEGQKETFTVIYFSDPSDPFRYDIENKTLVVNFTVKNQEYVDMDYIYRVSIRTKEGDVLASSDGVVGLRHGENITVSERLLFNKSFIGGRLYVELYLNKTGDVYRTIWQRIK